MLAVTDNTFRWSGYWVKPIPTYMYEWKDAPGSEWVDIFDQNGYDLTKLECLYALSNNSLSVEHRYKQTLKKDWFTQDAKTTGAVLNHAYLFERKGYLGDAAVQLNGWATINNTLYKVSKYRPKWGIDFSMDWVDHLGNVFEILHFEFDGFNYNEIQNAKEQLESKFLSIDWEDAGKSLLARKSEWHHLGFFEQSDWKCNYFGIMPERFKMVAW